jgi:rubrerythrin
MEMHMTGMRLSAVSSRRGFLWGAGRAALLSGAAVALLGNESALAAKSQGASSNDVAILNVALGLEHEAIAAYQIGAETGLLDAATMGIAVAFQSHHKAHRDALIATIEKLGGSGVAAMTMDEYAKSAKLGVANIKTATDIVKLAQRLELGAVNAYLGVIPAFQTKDLAKVAGRLAADETMHYTALTQALGGALPAAALSFGA